MAWNKSHRIFSQLRPRIHLGQNEIETLTWFTGPYVFTLLYSRHEVCKMKNEMVREAGYRCALVRDRDKLSFFTEQWTCRFCVKNEFSLPLSKSNLIGDLLLNRRTAWCSSFLQWPEGPENIQNDRKAEKRNLELPENPNEHKAGKTSTAGRSEQIAVSINW
jgi:hypothetical protein